MYTEMQNLGWARAHLATLLDTPLYAERPVVLT